MLRTARVGPFWFSDPCTSHCRVGRHLLRERFPRRNKKQQTCLEETRKEIEEIFGNNFLKAFFCFIMQVLSRFALLACWCVYLFLEKRNGDPWISLIHVQIARSGLLRDLVSHACGIHGRMSPKNGVTNSHRSKEGRRSAQEASS